MGTPQDGLPVNKRSDPKSRRISLIGKTQTITKGLYKGFTGTIVSLTENKVRMELQAKGKTITVPLDHLNIEADERERYTTNRCKFFLVSQLNFSDWKNSNVQGS
jgi:transcription elongation factor